MSDVDTSASRRNKRWPAPAPTFASMMEIEVFGDYRVRVGSGFDSRALMRVLDVLGRAEGERKKSR